MEKSFIDKIASGELDPHDVVRDLMSHDRVYIEDRIANLDLESVIRNNGTIAGLQAANALQSTIKAMRSAFGIPDPLVESVDQMRDTWQKVKSENGFGDPNTMTDEQVMSAVNLLGKALQAAPEQEQAAPKFPPELDNDRAKELLQMAIDRNIIDKSYKPAEGSTHETIAYLSATASLLLGLNKTRMKNGQYRVLWKPFESLFGIKYLAQTYSKMIDNEDGTLIKFPPNHKTIDEIYYKMTENRTED